MKENVACAYHWDRVATGRRHASLHMDVRFLACPSDKHKPYSPSHDQNYTELLADLCVLAVWLTPGMQFRMLPARDVTIET